MRHHQTVKKGLFFILGACGMCVLFMIPRVLLGIEIGPATLHDIVKALGPDSKGLYITAEALPDLFALTASRIEENPKQFVIEQPYVDGRWKGGKAVIEYARDLSYTLVSVYDKDGHRQRIYSVRTSYSEHVARQESRQTSAEAPPESENVPENVPEENWTTSPAPPVQNAKPVARQRSHSDSTPTANAESNVRYEWDEAKATYVPVSGSGETGIAENTPLPDLTQTGPEQESAPAPTPRRHKRRHHEEITVATARTSRTSSSGASSVQSEAPNPSVQSSGVWLPVTPKAKPAKTSAGKVKVANTTWVERRPDSSPAASHLGSPDARTVSGRHPSSEEAAPERQERTALQHRHPSSEEAVPERQERTALQRSTEKPAEETAPPKHHRPDSSDTSSLGSPVARRVSGRKHQQESAPATSPQPTEVTATRDEWVPKSIEQTPTHAKKVEIAKRPVQEEPPSTEELLSRPSPENTEKVRETAPAPTPRTSPPRAKTVSVEEQAQVPIERAATPRPKAVSVEEQAPAPVHAKEARAPEPVPSTEELLAPAEKNTGPDTHESDKWVPKATPKPTVAEPEVPREPMQVASIPKPAPVDNSVDNLLKMASEGKSGMPHESDTWVPKKTEAPKPDVDLNKELMRVREQERQQAIPKPAVKIRHDINNPEEGVLPVSSFEKFSGPLYGRHREYERRFYPGKKARPGAPNHDFYVEEVDRKKEIHNIYFYKHEKGKAPKLVAVERHEKVSFLGNYDIEKEDKGKISTYN